VIISGGIPSKIRHARRSGPRPGPRAGRLRAFEFCAVDR